jgi:dihydropteroate synthase
MLEASQRWNPRYLAHVTTPPDAAPVLRLDALEPPEAAALQEAAATVGAAALVGPRGALVRGTPDQHVALAAELAARPPPASRLGQAIAGTWQHQFGPPPPPTRLGAAQWEWGRRTYVMGILNVSPDSFSGDGLATVEDAVAQARAFAAAGADLLDVGGESTRPGFTPLSAEEERARVLPVLRALREAVALPLSVDTYKPEVAEAALAAGACMINDITGLRAGPALAALAARHGAALVLMHNRPAPAAIGPLGGHNPAVAYDDLLGEVLADLRAAVARAVRAGVPPTQILVDPGIGFGKTREQNLVLLARLGELRALGHPILLGSSRKSVIGLTLHLPPDQRVEGTAATVALGIRAGADVVRVHDVHAMARVARLSDAIARGGPPAST